MKPTRSILDRTFKYTPAAATDLRKTFARVRKELKQKPPVVVELRRKK